MLKRRMAFVAGGAALGLVAGCASAPPGAGSRGPVIDMHLHAYPDGMSFESTPVVPNRGQPTRTKNGAEHRELTLAELRRLNVVKGFVSSGAVGAADPALAWAAADPDRIVAAMRMDGGGAAPLPDLERLTRALEQGRYGALGEIGAQYAGLSLSDRRFRPYLALAERLGVPVGVHTGVSFRGISFDPCCRAFRSHYGNPQTVEAVLNRHPKLKLYLMHAGWPYLQETIAMLHLYPQLYADLAVINWILPRNVFYPYLEALMNARLGKQLMYGSDQMRWPEMMESAIASIEQAPFLTAEQKRDVLCDNAARFLGLEGDRNPCTAGTGPRVAS